MSTIKNSLLFAGSKGEKYLSTLYDRGTNLRCIH